MFDNVTADCILIYGVGEGWELPGFTNPNTIFKAVASGSYLESRKATKRETLTCAPYLRHSYVNTSSRTFSTNLYLSSGDHFVFLLAALNSTWWIFMRSGHFLDRTFFIPFTTNRTRPFLIMFSNYYWRINNDQLRHFSPHKNSLIERTENRNSPGQMNLETADLSIPEASLSNNLTTDKV